MLNDLKKEVTKKMDKTIESLKSELSGIRTSRASPDLLSSIKAEVYGQMTPIKQLANVSVPEPRMLLVEVYDKNAVKPLEQAIRQSSLRLNPSLEGNMLRITLPDLTQQRRAELVKHASSLAEQSKVSLRNARHFGINKIKEFEKNSEITEDDREQSKNEMQKLTDTYVSKVEEAFEHKKKSIMGSE